MLVLSRKQDEQVKIGTDITITVLSIRGGVIKLGIEAPKGQKILRGELAKLLLSPQPQGEHETHESIAV